MKIVNYIYHSKIFETIFPTHVYVLKNELIGVIADYDVDGSTSAALLCKFFKSINQKVILKIPDRLKELKNSLKKNTDSENCESSSTRQANSYVERDMAEGGTPHIYIYI